MKALPFSGGPGGQWWDLGLLTLQWCESDTYVVETVLQVPNIDLFPG